MESDRHRSLRNIAVGFSKWLPMLGTAGAVKIMQEIQINITFRVVLLRCQEPLLWLEFTIIVLLLLIMLLIAGWMLVELSALSESESLSSSFESLDDDELSSPIYAMKIKKSLMGSVWIRRRGKILNSPRSFKANP